MKEIKFTIPTSFKEIKDSITNKFKLLMHPVRRKNHATVLKKLEKDICDELNSGYWNADISVTMRKSLTMGFPNGKINRLINQAYKELK